MANTATPAERREAVRHMPSPSRGCWSLHPACGAQPRTATADVDALLGQSGTLRAAAETGLMTGDPLETAAAEVQLLAGAALDLLVAERLAGPGPGSRSLATEERTLGAPPLASLNELAELRAMIEAPQAYLVGAAAVQARGSASGRGPGRRVVRPGDGVAAGVHAALEAISDNAVTAGSAIVQGMFLIDFSTLRTALGMVGSDLTKELAADLVRVGSRALDFVLIANEKILALTGLSALAEARRRHRRRWAAGWTSCRAVRYSRKVAGRVLGTRAIEAEIGGWLTAYQGSDGALNAAATRSASWPGSMRRRRVVQKVNAGLSLVKLAAAGAYAGRQRGAGGRLPRSAGIYARLGLRPRRLRRIGPLDRVEGAG